MADDVSQQSEISTSCVEKLTIPDREEDQIPLLITQGKRDKARKAARKLWQHTKTNMLLILTIISVVLGIILGIAIRAGNPSQLVQQLISFPGEIFLRMLKMLIIPLIVFSLLAGLGSLNIKLAGALGIRTLIYYACTTTIAVTLGIVIVVAIKPGQGHLGNLECTNASTVPDSGHLDTLDSMLDLIRNIFPENLFTATFLQTETKYTYLINYHQCAEQLLNYTNTTNMSCGDLKELVSDVMDSCHVEILKSLTTRNGMNILGIIVFTISFSIVLATLGEDSAPFIRTINTLNEAIMKLVMFIMWYSPIGIASIIAGKLLEVDDILQMIQELGLYVVCVFLGLIIHGCILLPILFTFLSWSNPFKLIKGVLQALLVAFGTSSSSATLPVTMQCLEDNLGYDRRVTRFMLPVGATVNMDGTALYEAVAAVFIAQANTASLGFDKIIIIAITATLASIGAAGIPQAGLVTLVIVLTAIGLPAEEVALILAVDWFLDRFRTVVNVFGDCVGVGIVSKLSRKQLAVAKTTPIEAHSNNVHGSNGDVQSSKL